MYFCMNCATRAYQNTAHTNRKAHATVCRGAIARISSGRTPPLSTLHAHAITTHTTLVVHCCLSHTPLSPPVFSPILVCPPLSINILSSKAHSRTSTHLTLSVSINLSNARTRAARRRPPVCALDRRRLARIGLVVRALREWRAMIRSSSSRVAPLTHTRRGRERGGLDRRTRLI